MQPQAPKGSTVLGHPPVVHLVVVSRLARRLFAPGVATARQHRPPNGRKTSSSPSGRRSTAPARDAMNPRTGPVRDGSRPSGSACRPPPLRSALPREAASGPLPERAGASSQQGRARPHDPEEGASCPATPPSDLASQPRDSNAVPSPLPERAGVPAQRGGRAAPST